MDKTEKNISNDPPDKISDVEENIGSAIKSKSRGRKRKRQDSESSTDIELLPENALEVEKNLQTVALKNNLDDASVKKILKKVVTNDHVLALVKLREEEEIALSKEENPKPKLTRAKAKELMNVSPQSAPWNLQLTPIKHIPVKTRPEVEALITKELPDDEDDDEYEPTHDDVPSDDDQTLESCSDFDSQPPTPGAPLTPLANTSSPIVKQDGPFKVPQGISTPARRKLNINEEEEATIALRTRSKLSLSATPIEHIESSFVPPDDVPMPIGDDLWNQFLEECLNPAETSKNEDDDEADPEYNVAADPDAHDEDDDKLDKSILRISKKELNDLVTELFSIMPEDPTGETTDPLTANNDQMVMIPTGSWEGKNEPISDEDKDNQSQITQQRRDSTIRFSIGKSEPEDLEDPGYENKIDEQQETSDKENKSKNTRTAKTKTVPGNRARKSISIQVEETEVSVQPGVKEREPPPVLKSLREETKETSTRELTLNIDNTVKMLPEQILILQQQLRQHVQLCASNYLQLYVNPTHWNMAPPYKKNLVQLKEMVDKNPNSVVDVCNLKPALDLVTSWEQSVAEDKPENKEMVEFVQSEAERSRRRYAQNAYYVGNFPDLFLRVVSNSTVFQYPYLLPAMPYRVDTNKKFGYRKPEDELIALGLDQFWQYVEDNPEIFKRPRNHKAGRWGLVATCNLMVKHMFPWLSTRWLQYHVHRVRKNKDNPIAKFFATREVPKVEHKLLPYNPKLTLYEQPEYEMPKIWVRYLAKTSKRFRYYAYKRAGTGAPPQGVPVTVNVQEPIKNPLPPDFTRTIVCHRHNVNPKPPPEISQDKFDLVIYPNTHSQGPVMTINPLTRNAGIENTVETQNRNKSNVKEVPPGKVAIPNIQPRVINTENTTPNAESTGTLVPVTISKLTPSENVAANTTQTQVNTGLLANMFTVVQTSLGAYLIPVAVQNTNTVNSVTAPIASTSVVGNYLPEESKNAEKSILETLLQKKPDNAATVINTKKPEEINGHCQCCILLKKICKEKQARITDFFKPKKKEEKPCDCSHRKFPKVTKRLRMLVNNYKSRSWCEHRKIKAMLNAAKSNTDAEQRQSDNDSDEFSLDDMEYVTTFHMKLTRRSTMARNIYLKTRISQIFSKFDPEFDDPVRLSEELFMAFDVELIDLYTEFIGFLTPEQADMIDKFKDYFVHRCIGDLVNRVETEIQSKEDREAVLSKLSEVFTDNASSACELCAAMLETMTSYPRLAKHVFSLFPHRVVDDTRRCTIEDVTIRTRSKIIQPSEQSVNTAAIQMPPLLEKMAQTHEAKITQKRLEEAEPLDGLTICDDTLVPMDDGSSSNGENEETATQKEEVNSKEETDDMDIEDDIDIGEETIEGSVVSKTETHDTSESTEMSPLVMSDDEQETEIKDEPPTPSWSRDEDKFILELLQQYITPEARRNYTIIENLEENNVYQIIAEKCPQKGIDDVKNRVMRILDILVLNTK